MLGGCNLDRDIERLIRQAGFTFDRMDNFYLEGDPKFIGYLTRGVAH
jgi:hypothetical protein